MCCVFQSVAGTDSWHLASLDMTVRATRFAAFDMQKEISYRYRIRAINKYGVSEPSEPSLPVSLGGALGGCFYHYTVVGRVWYKTKSEELHIVCVDSAAATSAGWLRKCTETGNNGEQKVFCNRGRFDYD